MEESGEVLLTVGLLNDKVNQSAWDNNLLQDFLSFHHFDHSWIRQCDRFDGSGIGLRGNRNFRS
jgi:hypothetical protein